MACPIYTICTSIVNTFRSIRSLRTYMMARHGAEATNELFHNIQVDDGLLQRMIRYCFLCTLLNVNG